MLVRALVLTAFCSLISCSTEAEAPEVPKTPEAQVRAQVQQWVDAVKAGDKDAALACGTAEFQEKEKTWKKSFTTAVFEKGWKLVSYDMRAPEITGDTARVSGKAMFKNAEGEDDGEGLSFELKKTGENSWAITSLR